MANFMIIFIFILILSLTRELYFLGENKLLNKSSQVPTPQEVARLQKIAAEDERLSNIAATLAENASLTADNAVKNIKITKLAAEKALKIKTVDEKAAKLSIIDVKNKTVIHTYLKKKSDLLFQIASKTAEIAEKAAEAYDIAEYKTTMAKNELDWAIKDSIKKVALAKEAKINYTNAEQAAIEAPGIAQTDVFISDYDAYLANQASITAINAANAAVQAADEEENGNR